MRPIVVIPEPIGLSGLKLLEAECECVAPWLEGQESRDADSALSQADAIVVRTFVMDAERIARSVKLRLIAKHGVGLDNIDVESASSAGIPVVYTPGNNANAVAEHALGLMFSLARCLKPAEDAVRDGWRVERSKFMGVELQGRTLGIIGLGRIGKRLALKAAMGLGMNVVAFDPYVDKADYPGPARLTRDLDELLAAADVLSCHVPLTAETDSLIDAARLSKLKPGCLLINTSRGAVVDEKALVESLESGHLAGAALDVYEVEPLPSDHPLLQAPNVRLTPHIAGQTEAAMKAAAEMSARNVLDVLAGKPPVHVVNGPLSRRGNALK